MVEEDKAIQVTGNKLLPIADPTQAREAYQAYLELCQSVLVPYDKRIVDEKGVIRQESDYARIPQRKKVNGRWITEYVDAPKKSAWRKLARFYGVSTELLDKQRIVDENGVVTWHYSVRAWQGDVTTTGEAACSTNEKGKESTEHEVKSTAHTRAKNRAISDLIGFGQVSAEEMTPGTPRKLVDAETQVHPKEKKTKKKTRKQAALKPGIQESEDRVRAALEANDVDLTNLVITRYGDKVRIIPQEGYDEMRWVDDHQVILQLLTGDWMAEEMRWEVPPP